ncbi:hypothetical protein WAI453_012033 [Rhynchosporium graminicola]
MSILHSLPPSGEEDKFRSVLAVVASMLKAELDVDVGAGLEGLPSPWEVNAVDGLRR